MYITLTFRALRRNHLVSKLFEAIAKKKKTKSVIPKKISRERIYLHCGFIEVEKIRPASNYEHYGFNKLEKQLNLHHAPRWYRLQPRRMVRRGASVTNSNEEGKRLYQRIVAKLKASRLTLGTCRRGRYLRKALVAWQGFPKTHGLESSWCYTADWASDKTSRRSSGGVVTLGGGVLNWAKKQKSVALPSWESELFAAITSGTRSVGSRAS